MKARRFFIFLISIVYCQSAFAQFYNSGEDAGSLKWNQVKTQNYKIIYPRGLDSLARVFAIKLEEVRTPVAASLNYEPNGLRKRRMPVVLHSGTAQSNGMVGSTPYQMDLYTTPDPYGPLALPWEDHLIIHESRHAAQQQLGFEKRYFPYRTLLGDMFLGGMSALYGGLLFFEGDAVVAETALSNSGRGRSADFLEYYMMAFEQGEPRNWFQWRFGSLDNYTPNHYALGYLTLAGTRALFDSPTLCGDFYGTVLQRKLVPFPFLPLRNTVKATGGYNLRMNFNMVKGHFASEWALAAAQRAPFFDGEPVTPEPSVHTEYRGTQARDGSLWAVMSSLNDTPQLVCIGPDGETERLAWLGGSTSKLALGGKRIYWSEEVPDIRWSLKSTSCIWFYDLETGETGRLTSEGKLFNPAPSEDGSLIAATNYPDTGGTYIDILDAASGALLERIPAPDGLQFVECVWADGKLFAYGITKDGAGIYELQDGRGRCIAGPWPYQIKQLRSYRDRVLFVCDATGVNEIYSLTPGSSELTQLSSSRFGSAEYAFDGDTLYYGTLSPSGRGIYKAGGMLSRPADFSALAPHRTAEIISKQDSLLLAGATKDTAVLSPVSKYVKSAHLFRIHSWIPLYVDYDEVMDMSLETITSAAGLGGTVFFQNHLGTSSGSASIEKQFHGGIAGHLKMAYKGLFPAFEGSLNVNSSPRSFYDRIAIGEESLIAGSRLEGVGISGQLKCYVPLNLSRGGWYRGIIPQVTYGFSNSIFNTSEVLLGLYPGVGGHPYLIGFNQGKDVYMQRISTSIRAYNILGTAHSNLYPKLGIGAELGLSFRPGLEKIKTPVTYGHLYGYLPGFCPSHGTRLTATLTHAIGNGGKDAYIYASPRGLSDASPYLTSIYSNQAKFTAEYAMPVLPVEWSLLFHALYIRNFELIPHADFSRFWGSGTGADGSLYSAGATFNAVIGNFPADVRIGVRCSLNGGSLYDSITENVSDVKRFSAGLTMSVDL